MPAQQDRPTATSAGRYPLGRLLGRGGMADVYASVDQQSGSAVAVKVFRRDVTDVVDRHGAEVRLLASLRHPNLVELLDSGSHLGREFMVMALVEGPTLRAACDDGRLPAERVARIGAAVSEALAYVHSRGVVHRDVKPDNILLGPGSRVRLADFGIARLVAATRVTSTGVTIGTASYLAPEQVTGGHISPATDVYALGLVLLECLTGRREYDGTPLEAALARLHRGPRLPADLPAGWSDLLAALTATDPASRPSAADAAAVLRQLAVARPSHVLPLAAAGTGSATPTAARHRPPPVPRAGRRAPLPGSRSAATGASSVRSAAAGPVGRGRLLALTAAVLTVLVPATFATGALLRSSRARPVPAERSSPASTGGVTGAAAMSIPRRLVVPRPRTASPALARAAAHAAAPSGGSPVRAAPARAAIGLRPRVVPRAATADRPMVLHRPAVGPRHAPAPRHLPPAPARDRRGHPPRGGAHKGGGRGGAHKGGSHDSGDQQDGGGD